MTGPRVGLPCTPLHPVQPPPCTTWAVPAHQGTVGVGGRCPRAEGRPLWTEGLCPRDHSVGGAALTKPSVCGVPSCGSSSQPSPGGMGGLGPSSRGSRILTCCWADHRAPALPSTSSQLRPRWPLPAPGLLGPCEVLLIGFSCLPGLCWVSGTSVSLGSGGCRLQEHWPGQAVARGFSLPVLMGPVPMLPTGLPTPQVPQVSLLSAVPTGRLLPCFSSG